MKLVDYNDPVLRAKAQHVEIPLSKEDKEVAQAMIDHIKASQEPGSDLRPGIGIAAPQLGVSKQMFYVNVTDAQNNHIEELFVNPVIIKAEGKAALEMGEGCLSVPEDHENQEGLVHRNEKITISAYSYLKDKFIQIEATGFMAIVYQHEYDHLQGKLFVDRINYKKPNQPLKDEVLI